MLLTKGANFGSVRTDQSGRHQILEIRDKEFFGRIADVEGIVHDQRCRMDAFEKMRRGDVSHVERRILAHEHHVGFGEIVAGGIAKREMIAAFVPDLERTHARHEFRVA